MAKRETKAERSARAAEVLRRLDEQYGTEFRCYLEYETPWQLLIAVILSAQCTDARVNIVTRDLFKKYDTLEKFAWASQEELERDIHSIGFYHMKAKNIISCCRTLVTEYGGQVPETVEELTSLAGVGRKTANVIRGNIYHQPSVVVDTHVKRISRKLGFAKEEDPEKIEYELMKLLPEDHWILWNIHIITLGRTICTARSPRCGDCFLQDLCPGAGGKSGVSGKAAIGTPSAGQRSPRKASAGKPSVSKTARRSAAEQTEQGETP